MRISALVSDPCRDCRRYGPESAGSSNATGSIRAVPLSVEGREPVLFDFDTGNGGALIIYPAYAEAEERNRFACEGGGGDHAVTAA